MKRALVVAFVAACGAPPAPTPPTAHDAGAPDAAVIAPADASLPSLDVLAARGPADAPLMRELARFPQVTTRSPDVRATDRDLCVRVVFASSGPARVSLADASGAARGDAATASPAPAKGPACVAKGGALHLVVDAEAGVVVRAVVFGAP